MKNLILALLILAGTVHAQSLIVISGSNTVAPPSTVATPTFSPAGGTYSITQTVTISTTTPLAVLCYTTDGSTPTEVSNLCSGGTTSTYSTPISVATTQTVKAIGTLATYTDSAVGSAAYTISGAVGNCSVAGVTPSASCYRLCGDSTTSSCTPIVSTAAFDGSGNGNAGTWHGTPGGSVTGTYYTTTSQTWETYAGFFSSNYVSVPDAPANELSTNLSITFRLYLNGSGVYPGLVDKMNAGGTSQNYFLGLWGSTNEVYFGHGTSGADYVRSGLSLTTSAWNKVAITISGTTVIFYVNGSTATKSLSGAVTSTSDPLWIGESPNGPQYIGGAINDVQLFNYTLTPTQVGDLLP
jgi:hypothetical protein